FILQCGLNPRQLPPLSLRVHIRKNRCCRDHCVVQGSSDAQRTPASKVAARPAPPHVLCGCTRYRTLGGRCQRGWPPSHHGVGLVAARLSGGSKFSETSEVASVFIGNIVAARGLSSRRFSIQEPHEILPCPKTASSEVT